MKDSPPDTARLIASWAERLSAIARIGLSYAESHYDRDRYDQILAIAAEMTSQVSDLSPPDILATWARDAGYVTPKIGVEAAAFDDGGRLLLIQRADSRLWALPGGWADVGETAAEIAVREVREETRLDVRPIRLIGVYDSRRVGSQNPHHFYSLVFACAIIGGDPAPTAEALDVAFFDPANLPKITRSHQRKVADAFTVRDEQRAAAIFDL